MKTLVVIFVAFFLGAQLAAAAGQWRYVDSALPEPDRFTISEVVDILSDYSLLHQDAIVGGDYAGLMNPYTKKIYISDQFDHSIRRQTVIHELLHVYYLKNHNLATGGYAAGELAVERMASRLYEKFFLTGPIVGAFHTSSPWLADPDALIIPVEPAQADDGAVTIETK